MVWGTTLGTMLTFHTFIVMWVTTYHYPSELTHRVSQRYQGSSLLHAFVRPIERFFMGFHYILITLFSMPFPKAGEGCRLSSYVSIHVPFSGQIYQDGFRTVHYYVLSRRVRIRSQRRLFGLFRRQATYCGFDSFNYCARPTFPPRGLTATFAVSNPLSTRVHSARYRPQEPSPLYSWCYHLTWNTLCIVIRVTSITSIFGHPIDHKAWKSSDHLASLMGGLYPFPFLFELLLDEV